jgi:hypothetical protein
MRYGKPYTIYDKIYITKSTRLADEVYRIGTHAEQPIQYENVI